MNQAEAVRKVLSCHSSGNFITQPDLLIKKITPEIMNTFLEANNLVWAVFSFGPILGRGAFFYKRDDTIDKKNNNLAQATNFRTPIGDDEFHELKTKWGVS